MRKSYQNVQVRFLNLHPEVGGMNDMSTLKEISLTVPEIFIGLMLLRLFLLMEM